MPDALVFNGINAVTGDHLLPPLDLAPLARAALGHTLPAAERDDIQLRVFQNFDYPVKDGVDPDDLAQTGWALIFPFAARGSDAARRQQAIRAALQPLLDHRRDLATRRHPHYYRECSGADAYRPGETKAQFLARLNAGSSGPVDPDKFPYYILLVGSPEEIPYRFQYQLDVQYAVGRIHFDTIEEYACYAENVVEAEPRPRAGAPTAAFFAAENPNDSATYASARHLVEPLVDHLVDHLEREPVAAGWRVRRFLAEQASKEQLGALLGHDAPRLLFTASHGVGFPDGHAMQRRCQGALLCQDWPGPGSGRVTRDHYFAADDIAGDADLRGLISFHFACFGAGTPRQDDFVRRTLGTVQAARLAPRPFLAQLPLRMLGRARGALACVGHVDRAWGASFLQTRPGYKSRGAVSNLATFESAIASLMKGNRVGHALDHFNIRYAELSSDLATHIEEIQVYGRELDEEELALMWLYASDARNYAVLGDPAVRLAPLL